MSGQQIERRSAAIVAADVVGTSGLMVEDETGTVTVPKRYRHWRELAPADFSTGRFGGAARTKDRLMEQTPDLMRNRIVHAACLWQAGREVRTRAGIQAVMAEEAGLTLGAHAASTFWRRRGSGALHSPARKRRIAVVMTLTAQSMFASANLVHICRVDGNASSWGK